MLYLDTSAFVKCYFKDEEGSDAVVARAVAPDHELFTSVLTYAEMHSVMARKHRERQISLRELSGLRAIFERDWALLVSAVELTLQT
jgi:predicted nucleic acid-binding protein